MLDLENPHLHSVWLEVKLHNFNTLVCCFYRPPNADVTYWNDFEIMIDKALDLNQNVIMLGDINEDQFKHNSRLFQSISLYNMRNVISQATRVTANTATLIDPILISDTISCLNSEVIPIPQTVSDHHATAIHVTIPLINSKPIQRNIWLYKYADFERLNNLITCTNWEFFHDANVNEATVMFTNKLIELMKLCIPNKLVTVRPNDKPWYDSCIRRSARKRDRQKHISIDNPTTTNWNKYKHLRNKVNNMIKHAKEQFYSNLETSLDELNTSNPKKYWKTLKQLIKTNSHPNSIPPLQSTDSDGNLILHVSDIDKSNCLNKYFASIASLNDSTGVLPQFFDISNAKLYNLSISESEIMDVIKCLITNKAVGGDLISHIVLKKTCNSISKLANKLIYSNQSGFLKGHSTVAQLIDIFDQITKGIDEKKLTCMVFCDISKAFDRVWHTGLLFKLKQNGFDGYLLNWKKKLSRESHSKSRGRCINVSNVRAKCWCSSGICSRSIILSCLCKRHSQTPSMYCSPFCR